MRIYSIFDDFDEHSAHIMEAAGGNVDIHPLGTPRPNHDQMKRILEEYDCVIIGTSQKITEDMFENVHSSRIIATASVGLDHICIPKEKRNLVTIINTPKANAQSVAEYTIGCALSCEKRLAEGDKLYKSGKDNKSLYNKPEDLSGKVMGVVGAGNISQRVIDYAQFFGMKVICWTRNPNKHVGLESAGVQFVSLKSLAETSDIISVNLPNSAETKGIISSDLVKLMKVSAVFISVSRIDVVDFKALFEKAKNNPSFYVCLDIDLNDEVLSILPSCLNVMVSPHIAGGTIETRKRMFAELSEQLRIIIADSN